MKIKLFLNMKTASDISKRWNKMKVTLHYKYSTQKMHVYRMQDEGGAIPVMYIKKTELPEPPPVIKITLLY